jgi:acetylornithine deacetylase/succinyl-diaminopimelate desuccinylase-like protein
MKHILEWLKAHEADQVRDLAELVAIPSISTDRNHPRELEQSGELVCTQMRRAGLQNVEILRCGDSYPYAYGEWLGAPGKPTVFLYSHHDVQPVNEEKDWKSPPWTLTEREGRLYGRGSADDKGAVPAQLHAIAAYLQTNGSLPVNVKVLCEGEEEVGSGSNLDAFFKTHREKLLSDVIVVCDTENIQTDLPCLTYSLRGIVAVLVEVQSATQPVHSGTAGGFLADAALALDVILSRLYWKNGKIPVPGFYDKVRKMTQKERNTFKKLPGNEEAWRADLGVLPGVQFATMKKVHPREQTWRLPSATIIAQDTGSMKSPSNQVQPRASAIVSCRIVPDQDPEEVLKQLQEFLSKDPPWGVKVSVKVNGVCNWWMTDPTGPAFDAAMKAMKSGYGQKPAAIGCGGAIGFVGPLADLFNGAPALLFGIEDPRSNAHAPNESLDLGIFRKLTQSLAHLFENVGKLPEGRVKKEATAEEPAVAAAPQEAPVEAAGPV